VLRIASSCATRAAFVSVFGRLCDGEVIFVATPTPRSSGEDIDFRMTLAGGEQILAATGRVEECFLDGEGPHRRAGMLIRFVEIDPASRALVLELAARPAGHGSGDGGAVDVAEPDSETRPSGLPRSLIGPGASRPTITAPPVVVPRPSSPLLVTPAATPPPVLIDPSTGRVPDDEGPTGVKSMQAVVAGARGRRAADDAHDFEDEAGWDEGPSDVFGGEGGLRTDALGHEDRSSPEALAECAVYEESGPALQFDARGLPGLASRRSTMPNDAWEDDETLPPWLRGPAPDDEIDAPTGAIETELQPQAPVAGITEAAEPRGAPAEPLAHSPSVAISSSFEREALAAVSGELPRPRGEERYFAFPRRRWPLALGAAALSGLIGLAAGYAIGAGAVPGLAADEGEGAAAVPTEGAKATWTAPARAGSAGGGAAQPPGSPASAPGGVAGAVAAADQDDDKDQAAADDSSGSDEQADDEGTRADGDSDAHKGKHWLRRDHCGVDVRSDPDGADVAVAGQVVGSTPARIELPCGPQEIAVRRSRYVDAQRRVRLRPGKPDRIEVKLERPDHKVRIVSAPLGATVTVNGKPAGITPLVMTVKGYQQIRVRIERPGFEDWSRRLYAREPLTKVNAVLKPERGAGSAARGTAQPAAGAAPITLPPPNLPGLSPDAGGG